MRGNLKQQLSAVSPVLETLRSKKHEMMKAFSETQLQIVCICSEIAGNDQFCEPQVNERVLTAKKLGELKSHLQELQSEKVPLIYMT